MLMGISFDWRSTSLWEKVLLKNIVISFTSNSIQDSLLTYRLQIEANWSLSLSRNDIYASHSSSERTGLKISLLFSCRSTTLVWTKRRYMIKTMMSDWMMSLGSSIANIGWEALGLSSVNSNISAAETFKWDIYRTCRELCNGSKPMGTRSLIKNKHENNTLISN